uniref:COMM domain containing 9 n=1 Tax=Sinocyclocheilus anshuiensis TaxID=1608454 RepID=A0A671MZZ9_9TELE
CQPLTCVLLLISEYAYKQPFNKQSRIIMADSKTCKRKRKPNWTQAQLLLLAQLLLTAFHMLSHHVYQNLTSPEQILSLFPESFHSNLKNLITKILLKNSVTWRNEALSSQSECEIWRVDMKTASDSLSRMAVPTLQMKVNLSQLCVCVSVESTVTMELSKETLDTMIDGLGRIRDQLSAVVRK